MEVRDQLHVARERAHGTHRIEGWVGPKAGLNAVEKRKMFFPMP
jgi:hypothetical protein